MAFHALLVSQDDDSVTVLTSVLSGFGLDVQRCSYPDGLCRLTEQRFDAVLVDFDDPHSAALVLQNASAVSGRGSSVTVALLSDKTKVRNVFGAGANFVLYKPITHEAAQASLRAATAIIKRERRRSFRVAVQVPVQLRVQNGPVMEGILLDLSEEGLDVLAVQALYPSAAITAVIQLPDTAGELELHGEVAWANPNGQTGVRLVELAEQTRETLKSWLTQHAPEIPPEDPEPVAHCKLTDLSTGGCYVETESPFPERSGIILSLKASDLEVQAEGMVRVMHPGYGMGIEFAAHTAEERERVTQFITSLTSNPGTVPELLIMPRALSANWANPEGNGENQELEDPLLELLRNHEALGQEDFLQKLHQQRGAEVPAS
jgi:CheY-like chemotaxis protein